MSAWKISSADQLESIDMFGSAQWLWNRDNVFEMPLPTINPSIYVGMYDRQLYIQVYYIYEHTSLLLSSIQQYFYFQLINRNLLTCVKKF